jgi:Cu-Zn family superoxide dismutase
MYREIKLALAGILSVALLGRAGAARADAPATTPTTAPTMAVAMIHGNQEHEKVTGTVVFTAEADSVKMVANVDGLTPGLHGFHIHAGTDLSKPDFSGAGPHWDLDKHKHGAPGAGEHHSGDLGNLFADDKGHAHLELVLAGLTIEGKMGVVGHSVIIHAKPDDLTSQPAGDSGPRIAGGAIEVAQEHAEDTKPKAQQ